MTTRTLSALLLIAGLAACDPAAGVAPPPPPPAADAATMRGLVLGRQAAMHMATTLLVRSIRPAAKSGANVADQEGAAQGLALWGQAIPDMFPAGSALPGSRARPEIWRNKADFDAKAAAFTEAAARLEALAKAGDAAGFSAQADLVGARCAACHETYRAPG